MPSNPYAFPVHFARDPKTGQFESASHFDLAGMELRDWFAGQLLPTAMANFYGDCAADGDAWSGHDDVADHCYRMADAMLRAREKAAT